MHIKNLKKLSKGIRGIGLLELMLSLSIIAILLVMATRYYQVTNEARKYNEGANEIMQIQTVVYDWKGARTDFGAPPVLSTKAIANSGLIPKEYTQTQDQITHPWSATSASGDIDIKANTNDQKQAVITLSNLPLGPCTQLAHRFDGGPNIDSSTCDEKSTGSDNTLEIIFH